MKILKSIIAVFLAVAIAVISFVPAFALDPGVIVDGAAVAPSFFDWAIGSMQSFGNWMNGFFNENVCQAAGPTANYRHIFEVQYTMSNGKMGYYNICKNCGMSAGEVLEPAYQEQVSELPAQAYNSDGSLLLVASHKDMYAQYVHSGMSVRYYYFAVCEHSTKEINDNRCNSKIDCSNNSIVLSLKSGTSGFNFSGFYFNFSFETPIDGYYSIFQQPVLSGYYLDENQQRFSLEGSKLNFGGFSNNRIFYSAGQQFSPYCYYSTPSSSTKFSYFSVSMSPPIIKVEPFDPESGTVGESYGTDTRPTVITGDYGIVDNQGIATIIKDCTIVNETTNNYYNPATGQNYPIKDWSYDYPSREYTITTDSNNTVTITYGDENVTIQEGDTIYNIYYVVDGMGEEKPPCEHDWQIGNKTDPTCSQPGQQFYTCSKCGERKTETIPTIAHDWQAETKTDPTCTQSGRQPYTCSKCGEVKSDTIPALGHNWQVKQSVNTQYDDTGQLTQEGYTIYECTRCGEQYKTGSGSGPPPSGGGDAPGGNDPGGEEGGSIWDKLGDLLGTLITGISTLLGSVLGKLLEALTSLSELILGGLGTVVETVLSLFDSVPQLFGGFLAFLSAVFPFLPEEMVTLLTFGLAAVVFIGILKAVRK